MYDLYNYVYSMRDARDPTSPSVGNAVDVDPADQATRRTCFGFLGIWYTLQKTQAGSRELVLQTNAKQNHSLTTTCRPEGWWDLSPPHIFKESRKKSTVIVPKMLQIRPRNPLKMEAGATLLDARKARGYPKSRFEERSRSGADGVS